MILVNVRWRDGYLETLNVPMFDRAGIFFGCVSLVARIAQFLYYKMSVGSQPILKATLVRRVMKASHKKEIKT